MAKYFKCFTDKNPVSYSLGEEIVFEVYARENGENIDCPNFEWQLRGDDGEIIKGTASIKKDEPFVAKYTLKRAGFVHLNCVALDEKGEKIEDFDPLDSSAGVNVLDLKYSDTLPEDFFDYWSEIENMVAQFPVEIEFYKERENNKKEGFKEYEVWVKTPVGRPASGYVSIPVTDKKIPIRISFLGYGVHAAHYEYDENAICGCFNAHGFENTLSEEKLKEKYPGEFTWYGFDNEQNSSNKTTYFRNMMIRNLIALKYLKSLPQWDKKDISSEGGSQGALQAITLAAHDKDVTKVHAYKPWFCDLNSVNEGYLNGWRPDFKEGLRYFDTVAQGMQLECPIQIDCYLGDYVCPPKTVMALYNSIKSEKKIKFVQSARHSYFAPENEDVEPLF